MRVRSPSLGAVASICAGALALSACVSLSGLAADDRNDAGQDSAAPPAATTAPVDGAPPDALVDASTGTDSAVDAAADALPAVVIGSFVPCMGKSRALHMEGDTADFIHPGTDTITAATWTPSATPMPTPTRVELGVTPVDSVQGSSWNLTFASPQTGPPLTTTVYLGAARAPFAPPGKPGLEVTGNGHGCNVLTGSFQVLELGLTSGALSSFAATFEQHCESGVPALRGCVVWHAN